jgi:hypothetical protein
MESRLGRVVRVMELDAGVLDPTRHSGAWLSVQSPSVFLPLPPRDRCDIIEYRPIQSAFIKSPISPSCILDARVHRDVYAGAEETERGKPPEYPLRDSP